VLRLVAATVTAAHDAGLSIEICGESASVPELAALYVGFGVDELSVAPARTDEIRATVRRLSASEAVAAAATSLEADSADEALAPARALLSGEGRDQQGELLGGRDGVVA
jgi:phosphoenolpyruvate-protein kinase (PTS system EI component)